MNIITCIKQVPASSNVKVDSNTGVLIRESNNVKMNPYDLYGLETAFQIKEMKESVDIHAVTMGPPSAKQVLEEALYMGADEATLVSDRRFAGADVLATSYTLSQLIDHISNYDMIICGKQTTDGDTAQVGPEIAEFLNIPHVPYVVDIIEINRDGIVVKSTYDTYDEIVSVKFPCLLTLDKGSQVPRLPSYKRKQIMKTHQIETITLDDLDDQNPNHYGLNGSPTQVEEIFPPDKRSDSIQIKGSNKEVTKEIMDILAKNRYL
ncbi:MAG: electron transfer flavoprotein subunit beta/FixA family protein [Candidatus Izimaplasma sp.]|nr:electron transfer flavoprotein subunit beta/FixA family protein [Candidatus Izimaplasma bacterium]